MQEKQNNTTPPIATAFNTDDQLADYLTRSVLDLDLRAIATVDLSDFYAKGGLASKEPYKLSIGALTAIAIKKMDMPESDKKRILQNLDFIDLDSSCYVLVIIDANETILEVIENTDLTDFFKSQINDYPLRYKNRYKVQGKKPFFEA